MASKIVKVDVDDDTLANVPVKVDDDTLANGQVKVDDDTLANVPVKVDDDTLANDSVKEDDDTLENVKLRADDTLVTGVNEKHTDGLTLINAVYDDRKIFQLRWKLLTLGTAVLQKLFDYRVGNDFTEYLTSNEAEETKLNWLMDTNRITKQQVALLSEFRRTTSSSYVHKSEQTLPPTSDLTPSSSLKFPNLDISLLTVLLRYVCGLRAPNDLVWKEPSPMDMSIEADISRLGHCRNSIIKWKHNDEENVDELLKKLLEILTRLGRGVGIKDFLLSATEDAHFDDYLNYLNIYMLEEWYANDQRVIQFDQKYAQTFFFKDSDDDAWTIDEENVSVLLSQGKLPNAKQLKAMCEKFGSSSGTVLKVCAYICNTLQMTSHHIKRCWPAYVYDKNSETDTNLVTFVAVKYIKQKIDIYKIFGYNIYELFHGFHSAETSEMVDRDIENADSSHDKMKKVEKCVSKRSLYLMHTHSNITLIEASTVKSIGYTTKKKDIIEKPCVAIYVHKKGYIPLGEEPFPTKLDEFDTDVRECVVSFLGNAKAYERHDNLLMGTSIAHDESAGTLGGFVEHPRHGLCGLTSAHVLYDGPLNVIAGVKHWTNVDHEIYVDQPASKLIGTRIGKVVCTILRQDAERVGIEIALFSIQDRLPNSGQFAIDTPADCSTNDYNSGSIVNKGNIETYRGQTVIKFGCETGRTEAKIFSTEASFTAPFSIHGDSRITLNKQLSVVSNTQFDFAAHGDSGSLVFVKDNGELKALGVLVAVAENTNKCYLTPLSEILDALNEGNTEQFTMKRFEIADYEPMPE